LVAGGVTTVAREASGVYGHVLFLTLLEAGLEVLVTPPQFARQIPGRPKPDRLDGQWIRRLHHLGMLPSVFRPDDPTHTLRDDVRQRANRVRLGAPHVPRMPKALGLMNLKLTAVLGDTTGVTGLKIVRAIVAGERDPHALARLRDRRCKSSAAEIATALDGRYRPEHRTELTLCLKMWDAYQEAVGELDRVIADHRKSMRRQTALPPLPPQPRVRGRKPHDPKFDVREAPYLATGVDRTAIEGIDAIHALTLVSELGSDFSKWPSVKHVTSWLGLCPNGKKTGGRVQSSRTGWGRTGRPGRSGWRRGRGSGARAIWERTCGGSGPGWGARRR
jgi:transposase